MAFKDLYVFIDFAFINKCLFFVFFLFLFIKLKSILNGIFCTTEIKGLKPHNPKCKKEKKKSLNICYIIKLL